MEKLNFINDSICIYTQEFLCDIDSAYKTTQIKCFYSVKNNYVVLSNLTKRNCSDSNSMKCISLPYSIIQQCKYMREDLSNILSRPASIDAPPSISLAELYGFINIVQTDTLYYHNDVFFYNKSFKNPTNNIPFLTRIIFFVEKGREQNINKLYKKARKLKKRIPFNQSECQGAVPWYE